MAILFTVRVLARKLLRGNCRRNTSRILFWCLAWGSNPGFTSNKTNTLPTRPRRLRHCNGFVFGQKLIKKHRSSSHGALSWWKSIIGFSTILFNMTHDCNGLSLLIFSDSFWVRWLFNVCVWVFCTPNATILLAYIPAKTKMSFIFFLPKSLSFVSRSQAHLFKRLDNQIRSAEG